MSKASFSKRRQRLFVVRSPEEAAARPNTEMADLEYERGYALEEAGRLSEAKEAYRLAIAHDPRHADALVNLGRILHEEGDAPEALRLYRTALETRPTDGNAAFNIGVALEDIGETEPAIEAYVHALTLDPANADAHYNIARLYERNRPTSELAIRHLVEYRKLNRQRA